MREEYDIKSLNPRQNPYTKTSKKPITINLDESVVGYFKEEAINRYLLFLVRDKLRTVGLQPCFFVVKPKLDFLTFDKIIVLSE